SHARRRARANYRPRAQHGRYSKAGPGSRHPDARAAAIHTGLRGPARSEAPGAGSQDHTCARMARSPFRSRRYDLRRGRPGRASDSGRQPRHGPQQHHQHATADPRLTDPGYYLISKGRPQLEKELGFRLPMGQWLRRAWFGAATPFYLASIALWTAAILAVPLALTASAGAPNWSIILLAVVAAVPASDLATALVQRFVTQLVGPQRLPKLELTAGVPEEA